MILPDREELFFCAKAVMKTHKNRLIIPIILLFIIFFSSFLLGCKGTVTPPSAQYLQIGILPFQDYYNSVIQYFNNIVPISSKSYYRQPYIRHQKASIRHQKEQSRSELLSLLITFGRFFVGIYKDLAVN